MPTSIELGTAFSGWTVTPADLVLSDGSVMSAGTFSVSVRYKIQYIPSEVTDPSRPAFYLQTYPATAVSLDQADAHRQNLAGPSWNAAAVGSWTGHNFQFQVGTFPLTGIPLEWVGSLYSLYVLGSSSFTLPDWSAPFNDPANFPVIVSQVTAGSAEVPKLKVTGHVSTVRFR